VRLRNVSPQRYATMPFRQPIITPARSRPTAYNRQTLVGRDCCEERPCLIGSQRAENKITRMPTTLRRSTLSRDEDYTVIWKEADGRELSVGRIFHATAGVSPDVPWFWGVEFHQAQGRSKPWYGYAADFEARDYVAIKDDTDRRVVAFVASTIARKYA